MKLSQPTRILLALILGLAIGIVAMSTGQVWTEHAARIAEPIGGLWLNALQMTIVPLVVSLIITGIAGAAEAARASRLATRALVLFAVLQIGRVWVIRSLGDRWTTRIIVKPGAPLVRRGPYRFVNHPNYLIVAAEIAVLPLVFGLWQLAVLFSALNAIVLTVRIRAETRALASLRG